MEYAVPADTSSKEKIIGGLLDFKQVGFLTVGVLSTGFLTLLLWGILSFFSLIFTIWFAVAGLVLAFKKKYEMTYPQYLKQKFIYKNKIKIIDNQNERIPIEKFLQLHSI